VVAEEVVAPLACLRTGGYSWAVGLAVEVGQIEVQQTVMDQLMAILNGAMWFPHSLNHPLDLRLARGT